jgi:peroxiredoxin
VVVFPIRQVADSGSVSQFHEALRRDGTTAEPPFPLVLDVELRAVDQLGIRADLSKPATYILDKQGQVRFAYVGATIADRPSIQSMLEQLAAVNADAR